MAGIVPWGTLFVLLFMTMGPIRAMAVFANVGTSDHDPGVRPLAAKAALFAAGGLVLAVLIGDTILEKWGVSFRAMIAAAGVLLLVLSLQALLFPASQAPKAFDPAVVSATYIAFPGLLPPIAVAVAVIFAAQFPGVGVKAGIAALGLVMVVLDWLAMRHAKAILAVTGTAWLQLFGAVFGVLQVALAVQFLLNAAAMP